MSTLHEIERRARDAQWNAQEALDNAERAQADLKQFEVTGGTPEALQRLAELVDHLRGDRVLEDWELQRCLRDSQELLSRVAA